MAEPLLLIVDDEPLFVRSVLDIVAASDLGMRGIGVDNGAAALDLIAKEDVAVLLTDLSMPVMDGYHLLAELVSRGFQAPIIIATAFGNPVMELQLRALERVHYIDKPADLDSLLALMAELRQAGSSQSLELKGFVQLLATAARPTVLRVRAGSRSGRLVFSERGLVDARTGRLQGEPAVMEILSWPHPMLQLQRSRTPETITIHRLVAEMLGKTSSSVASENSIHDHDDPNNNSEERKLLMNVKAAIAKAMEIDGAVGVALVNHDSGMTLGAEGAAIDIELAASGNTEVVRAKMAVMGSLGLEDKIEDILITLGKQYHIIRPLQTAPDLFLYLAIDRSKGNLGLARHQLQTIEKELEI